ncbi:MAG: hypothetical protein LRY62_01130, partial [Alphaproteobacteria bacterium]|nr:hypothetical protein [Alphaproteobacteria bacterium]
SVILPAYFAEGALLCRLVVMAGKNGKTIAPLPAANNRLVMAATLLYVLIKLAQAFAGGLGMEFAMHQQVQEENAEGSASLFFASLFLLGFTIWAFRLVWLYIPLVQGYSMIEFLHRIRGMKTSFVMIGTWLLCFVPLALLLIIVAGLLGDMLGHSEETPSNIYRFLIIFMQSGLELVAVILSTLAIGFGVHSIMSGGAPKPRNKDLA